MNVFFVDERPEHAARQLMDVHVMSTIREGLTMLSAWYHNQDEHEFDLPWPTPTHVNHPMTLWVRSRIGNVVWLVQHVHYAYDEYVRRFKKRDTFKRCQIIIPHLREYFANTYWKTYRSLPPQCMPDEYRVEDMPILAYRQYYVAEKLHLSKWTPPGVKPAWIDDPFPGSAHSTHKDIGVRVPHSIDTSHIKIAPKPKEEKKKEKESGLSAANIKVNL